MKQTSLAWVIRTLAWSDQSPQSDRDLLARFVAHDDQTAFSTVVARHSSMVLGVCRRLLANQQDAEDACQAVFLLLARKAAKQSWQSSAANWLYATARNVAHNARKKATRRTKHEANAAVAESIADVDRMTGRELMVVFDEVLEKLPPRYREPLVLCCLEGLTRDEAATRLGVPEATLKSQLERARRKLADALTKRGCSLGMALLTTATTSTAAAVPPRLLESILVAVGGSPPPAVAALAQGVVMNALVLKTKLAVLVMVGIVGATVLGVGLTSTSPVAAEPPKPEVKKADNPAIASSPKPDNKAAASAAKEAAEVLDKVEGDPMARCRLWCQVADLRGKLGDRDGAYEAIRKARDAADGVKGTNNLGTYGEWRRIGQSYGRLGDAKAVTDLAAAVPPEALHDGYPRDMILQESSFAAAEAGHAMAAEQILAAHSVEAKKKWMAARVRRLVLLHRARSGDVAGAVEAALKLPTNDEKVAALMSDTWFNLVFDYRCFPTQQGIVSVQLQRGDRPGARSTAMKALSQLPDVEKDVRARAAASVVQVMCELDELPSARAALALLPPEPDNRTDKSPGLTHWWDLVAKGFLAAAEARAGNDKAALALAKDFSVPAEQGHILQNIALAQARTGRMEASKAMFARCNEVVTDNVHNLICAQTLAGDYDGATETAKTRASNDTLWEGFAYNKALTGDFTGAWEATAYLADPRGGGWRQGTAVLHIAKEQAKAGKADDAREWAGKQSDPLIKAHVLFGIAEGLFQKDSPALPKQP